MSPRSAIKNLSGSAPNFQNRTCISEVVKMSPRSAMLQSKLNFISKDDFTGNGNFLLLDY